MKKIISGLVSFIVVLIILAFFIVPKESFSYNENRYLAKFPKFSVENVFSSKFMSQLDDYITDHFPFRESLLGFKSRVYKTLGVYKQMDLYYGRDGKLYQEYKKPSGSDKVIRRVQSFSEKVDAKVSFMLVPTSVYINQDRVPKYNTNYDEKKTFDYYIKNLDVDFIDVRDSFFKNKDDYLYYGTDHHWTTKGAYLAYLEYCKFAGISPNHYSFSSVNQHFYGTLYSKVLDRFLPYDTILKVDDQTKYKVYFDDSGKSSDSLYNYQYLNKKDKYSFFLDNNHSLIRIENLNTTSNHSILIIKDSYANSFIPLLAPHYQYIHVIDPRYYHASISEYLKENKIENVLFLYNILTLDDDLGIVSIK